MSSPRRAARRSFEALDELAAGGRALMMRAAAYSTHPEADELSREVLRVSGSAMSAVLAGFFAAAGSEPGVLFSPLTVLVGGTGTGARAFDGRCRQPGLGAKRPRGFTPRDEIPDAAYAAVPASVAALVVACAYTPGTSVSAVVRRGIVAARKAGAPRRAALLERVSALGAGVLTDALVKGTLLGDFGPAQGGLLGSGDLMPPKQLDWAAREQGDMWVAPWALQDPGDAASEDVGAPSVVPQPTRPAPDEGHVVCAVDVRGLFVAVSFRRCTSGLPLPDLEELLPKVAVPVLRGVTRVEPGSPLTAPAPVAIGRGPGGQPAELIASPTSQRLGEPEIVIRRDPSSLEVAVVRR